MIVKLSHIIKLPQILKLVKLFVKSEVESGARQVNYEHIRGVHTGGPAGQQ